VIADRRNPPEPSILEARRPPRCPPRLRRDEGTAAPPAR
jgi:hypothetical protein